MDLFEAVAAEGTWIGTELPIDRAERRPRLEKVAEGTAAYLGAFEGDALVGQLGLHIAPYGVADLGMMVSAEWRGRGVGSALLTAAIDWARTSDAHKISLQHWPHNERARALYERFGFEQEGYLRRHYRRRNGELWDAVVMGLLL
jgi:RimJ/RimL family protein N-acetyltransferase